VVHIPLDCRYFSYKPKKLIPISGKRLRKIFTFDHVAITQGFKAIDALVFVDNFTMLRLLLSMSFTPVRIDHNRRQMVQIF